MSPAASPVVVLLTTPVHDEPASPSGRFFAYRSRPFSYEAPGLSLTNCIVHHSEGGFRVG
jgi:hypothetical protein